MSSKVAPSPEEQQQAVEQKVDPGTEKQEEEEKGEKDILDDLDPNDPEYNEKLAKKAAKQAEKEQKQETKEEIKEEAKDAAKEEAADKLKEAAMGGDQIEAPDVEDPDDVEIPDDVDEEAVDEEALAEAALAKMDGAGKGFLGKIIEIVKGTSNPHNRMQEIYTEPFALKGWQGDKKKKKKEYIMYVLPFGNSKYLCFDKPKVFNYWVKYTVPAMKAYKKEEKRLGKVVPKKGCCGMCTGVPKDIPNACQKKADKAGRKAARWDSRKRMATKTLKFTMKTTLQVTVPVPGIGGLLDIAELGMVALPPLPGLNIEAMKCDYGNCGATMDQIGHELSQMDLESESESESEAESEAETEDEEEGDDKDEAEEEDDGDDAKKGKEKDNTKETAQNAMEANAETQEVKVEKGGMSMKEKILDWLRQKMHGKDEVHAAINRLSDETIVSTIKDAETFLLRQRAFALESHKKVIKDKNEKKELEGIPRGIKWSHKMHNDKKRGGLADAWDISGFKVIKQEDTVKGTVFKKTYTLVVIQGPPRKSCFCFAKEGVKKTMMFPKNQEHIMRRIFDYDFDKSKPYYYDAHKPPMPRKVYSYDNPTTETAPQQQTMS